MNDLTEQHKALIEDVLNLEKVVDKSRLEPIELEQLNKTIEAARDMVFDPYLMTR